MMGHFSGDAHQQMQLLPNLVISSIKFRLYPDQHILDAGLHAFGNMVHTFLDWRPHSADFLLCPTKLQVRAWIQVETYSVSRSEHLQDTNTIHTPTGA